MRLIYVSDYFSFHLPDSRWQRMDLSEGGFVSWEASFCVSPSLLTLGMSLIISREAYIYSKRLLWKYRNISHFSYPNINTYLTSYMRSTGYNPSLTYDDFVFLTTTKVVLQGMSMPLVGQLCRMIGCRCSIFIQFFKNSILRFLAYTRLWGTLAYFW